MKWFHVCVWQRERLLAAQANVQGRSNSSVRQARTWRWMARRLRRKSKLCGGDICQPAGKQINELPGSACVHIERRLKRQKASRLRVSESRSLSASWTTHLLQVGVTTPGEFSQLVCFFFSRFVLFSFFLRQREKKQNNLIQGTRYSISCSTKLVIDPLHSARGTEIMVLGALLKG